MPDKFIIHGGKQLNGTIDVRGSKNAALPILAATILTKERCRINNLPLVLDVYRTIEILEGMGSSVRWVGKRSVDIENKRIKPGRLESDAVRKMRASILFLGPLLARFGKVERMQYPGGCSIGPRPIDVHLKAFEDIGARISLGKNFFSVQMPARPKITRPVILNEFSVTATENLLAFLSSISGSSHIKIAASEPHVRDLAKFLSKMGARINGAGTSTISVHGSDKLRGASHNISSDYIEAGTFAIATLAVGGKVLIRNTPISDLDLVLKKLTTSGADIRIFSDKNIIEVRAASGGLGMHRRKMFIDQVQMLPHPGIPTDLQSVFGVLATQTLGDTLIHEPMYENRLECLRELGKMGAKIKIYDPHRAQVLGPTRLKGAEVTGHDLRGGAALVIAGLAAYGKTVVSGLKHIERGYEDFDVRLRKLGADIKKI